MIHGGNLPSQGREDVFLSWLDCKQIIPFCYAKLSLHLFYLWGYSLPFWHATALGAVLVPTDHQFLIMVRAAFQGWNQVIPLSAHCDMSLAKSLGNNFLMTHSLMIVDCFMLLQSPPHAWLWLIKLSWERKRKNHCWCALLLLAKARALHGAPKEGQESICWDWAWFNSSYKASWQLSGSDRLIIRLSLNAKRKVIYIGFTPLASRKDPALR